MTTADAEATLNGLWMPNLVGVAADGPEAQTFAAIKLYFLGYVLRSKLTLVVNSTIMSANP